MQAWDAIGQLLEDGKSWSGHERNLLYLNGGNGRFIDISTIAGMAFPSDSRALAVTDWDRDGDLDVWMANRTAPRIRLALNQLQGGNHLRLHLQGVHCNRDAIGARVTLTSTHGKQLVRAIRAGEGYLSQSSKSVHFGLPADMEIQSVSIQWPGGEHEAVTGLALNQTYHVIQGEGRAHPMETMPVTISPRAASKPNITSNLRIIPHARVPLPSLPYTTPDGQARDASDASSESVLVVLWAPWCQPCLAEIHALSQATHAWKQAGVQICLINVEEASTQIAKEAPPHFQQGTASKAFLDAFDVTQRILTGRERQASIPSSFLRDAQGRLLAYYRGAVSPQKVLADLSLTHVTDADFRDRALPMPGRWLMRAMYADLLSIPNRLLALGRAEEAYHYLETHITGETPHTTPESLPSRALTFEQIGQTYAATATALGESSLAQSSLLRALHYHPDLIEPRHQLAQSYQREGHHAHAIAQFRAILQLDGKDLLAQNGLAWLLATAPQPDMRQPAEALSLAQQVCAATNHAAPEPLDTLAAAHAANGQFAEAIATAEKALALAQERERHAVAEKLAQRLSLYKQDKAFLLP